MNKDKLVTGQNLLVLRYSPAFRKDIIEQHQSIISNKGFCWFGKLGSITSNKILNAVLAAKTPMMLLYSKGKAFLCEFVEMTTIKPTEGYPDYYDTDYLCPICYYRFSSIEPVGLDILDNLIIRSSNRRLSDVFSKSCMASAFFVSYKEVQELPIIKGKKAKVAKLSSDDCIYRKNNTCMNSRCVNYSYKCEKPSLCSKQRR